MSDQKSITVSRLIDAPAKDIFDVLTLPQRHREFDGSEMIVSDDRTDRIQETGQVFRMNMNHESQGGDYQTDNHVIAYAENKLVGWATGPVGGEPFGWTWVYTLEPQGAEATEVTLAYDWSKVEDKKILPLLPAVPAEALEESLNRLAAAVV
ncbi:MAG: SRPBCC family protein [Propionibacteriaceae bacterium]|nr:SRPBCC family protein [Propionibacteriaceae bacterium]